MWQEFKTRAADKPILVVWLAAFLVGAGLNFRMGYELFSAPVGIAFVSVAIMGAYASSVLNETEGSKKAVQIVMMVGAFALGQWCGWQQLGLNMARSLSTLTSEAGQHNTASAQLKAARAERDALGVQRPIGTIEAERVLECKKVSRTYKDGVGPACTKLKGEEEAAKRAAELDAQLPELAKSMAAGPQMSDPDAPFAVPMAFASMIRSYWAGQPVKATAQDVMFYFSIFMIALLEMFAILGPWAFDLHGARVKPSAYPFFDAHDFGPKQLAHAAAFDTRSARRPDAAGEFSSAVVERRPQGAPEGPWPPQGVDGLNPPSETPARSPTAQTSHVAPSLQGGSLHGAPITINLHQPNAAPGATPGVLQPVTDRAEIDKQADDNVARLNVAKAKMIAPSSAQALLAPDVPVDRSALQSLLDSLIVFRAACVIDRPGAWLAASELYDVYTAYAGDRACAPQAFHSMFSAATGVQLTIAGDVPHYVGVALRREQRMEAV